MDGLSAVHCSEVEVVEGCLEHMVACGCILRLALKLDMNRDIKLHGVADPRCSRLSRSAETCFSWFLGRQPASHAVPWRARRDSEKRPLLEKKASTAFSTAWPKGLLEIGQEKYRHMGHMGKKRLGGSSQRNGKEEMLGRGLKPVMLGQSSAV